MANVNIVIAGARGAGKDTLFSGLQQLNAKYSPNTSESNAGASDSAAAAAVTGTRVVAFDLETKYYSASLVCHVLAAEQWESPSEPAHSALPSAEALILVIDATNPAAFEHAATWKALAESHDIGTLVCVVNKFDAVAEGRVPGAGDESSDSDLIPPSGEPTFLSTIQEWCISSGFETVFCSSLHPLAGAERREKLGLPRVYEALQSSQWSNMRRTQQPAVAAAAATLLSPAAAPAAQSAVQAIGGSGDAPIPARSGLGDLEAVLQGALGSRPDTDAADHAAVAGEQVGEGEDGDFGELHRVIAEIRRVRDNAQTAGLSDAERREAAARMAQSLFQMLGGAEGDEEGEDGSEEEEEGGGEGDDRLATALAAVMSGRK